MDEIAAVVGEIQALYPQIYHACHVQHGRRRSTEHRLSAQDSMYLGHLDRRTPTSPRRLARHLGISDSTLSAFLKRMEKLGYLERGVGSDRREVELRLTGSGEEAERATSILDGERMQLILSRVSAADRKLALRGLRILAEACREARVEYEASHDGEHGWKRPGREGDA